MALIVVPLSSTLLWLGWRARRPDGDSEDVDQRMGGARRRRHRLPGQRRAAHRRRSARRSARSRSSRRRPARRPTTSACASSSAVLRRHPGGRRRLRRLSRRALALCRPHRGLLAGAAGGVPRSRRRSDRAARHRRRRRGAPRDLALRRRRRPARSEPHAQPSDFDPRQRPWYAAALQSGAAAAHRALSLRLVERARRIGRRADAGRAGCIGFDASLGTLSPADRAVQGDAERRSSLVATGGSDIFIETRPCDPDRRDLPAGRRGGARAGAAGRGRGGRPAARSATSRSPAAPTS